MYYLLCVLCFAFAFAFPVPVIKDASGCWGANKCVCHPGYKQMFCNNIQDLSEFKHEYLVSTLGIYESVDVKELAVIQIRFVNLKELALYDYTAKSCSVDGKPLRTMKGITIYEDVCQPSNSNALQYTLRYMQQKSWNISKEGQSVCFRFSITCLCTLFVFTTAIYFQDPSRVHAITPSQLKPERTFNYPAISTTATPAAFYHQTLNVNAVVPSHPESTTLRPAVQANPVVYSKPLLTTTAYPPNTLSYPKMQPTTTIKHAPIPIVTFPDDDNSNTVDNDNAVENKQLYLADTSVYNRISPDSIAKLDLPTTPHISRTSILPLQLRFKSIASSNWNIYDKMSGYVQEVFRYQHDYISSAVLEAYNQQIRQTIDQHFNNRLSLDQTNSAKLLHLQKQLDQRTAEAEYNAQLIKTWIYLFFTFVPVMLAVIITLAWAKYKDFNFGSMLIFICTRLLLKNHKLISYCLENFNLAHLNQTMYEYCTSSCINYPSHTCFPFSLQTFARLTFMLIRDVKHLMLIFHRVRLYINHIIDSKEAVTLKNFLEFVAVTAEDLDYCVLQAYCYDDLGCNVDEPTSAIHDSSPEIDIVPVNYREDSGMFLSFSILPN